MHPAIDTTQSAATLSKDAYLEIRFSSLHEVVPAICHAAEALVSGSSRRECPKLAIVARELLENAIEHGNKNDPDRVVAFRLHRGNGHDIDLTVLDEGEGFDINEIELQPPAMPDVSRGGGLRLVNALCESLRIEDNGRRIVCRLSWGEAPAAPAPGRLDHCQSTEKE